MKENTIEAIRQKRAVSPIANEERKNYNAYKKAIKAALRDEAKSIPQIAAETKLPLHLTTYYIMTMFKFGEIAVDSLDDMDEYYLYKLKK